MNRHIIDERANALKCIASLQKEKHQIEHAVEKEREENQLVIGHYQGGIEEGKGRIRELEDEVLKCKEQIIEAGTNAQNQIKGAKDASARVEMDLRQSLLSMREQNKKKQQFKSSNDLVKLGDDVKNDSWFYEKKELERKFLVEKAELRRKYDAEIEAIKKKARAEAVSQISNMAKTIVIDNKRITNELRFQLGVIDEMQIEKHCQDEELKQLKMEFSINKQNEQEYATNLHLKNMEKQRLKSRLEDMKDKCARMNEALVREDKIEEKEAVTESNAIDYEDEKHRFQDLLSKKSSDLANTKRVLASIMAQRTEVENFLLDSLLSVKEKIKNERTNRKLDKNEDTSNIGQSMTWEDRERVLQLLIAQLNRKGKR
mmetsp:Transcript_52023/g.60788  ORF Transcript_52023/g.60788 Transcript_52023/m.60788 type:complete len:373 (+) Transcript_52023:240-1358(+)|eukprot:CAMPEP_0194355814 /NCGR_PEP_ID=MMETSP0174-20130528/3676_1 /TAXON_ID=216777 /ORGANISM="Proboscia alata, Strain PI-D3" /LENGTH=372 /DNA_ID=CAMNT_0039125243 /DNA_START=240 /DNA_END=1358 /DNA_ORIENTATION=+